ncbi:MAG: Dam family site-specific DNA-(adenine-N6)-methyltransferase [Rikenellaceae bacterium]
MNKLFVPPIKSQGIKTKLVPWINDTIARSGVDRATSTWIEPFFGTGVVGFNAGFKNNVVGDTNPHIINFYNSVKSGEINHYIAREYFTKQDVLLQNAGYDHYRYIRDRFNESFSPLDFIFLSRAGFNGMMRFNSKGKWNIPFCKKPNRFAPAYITKICNQIKGVESTISNYEWEFETINYIDTINRAKPNDFIYCDPPYYGRYVDYYNGWTEQNEDDLFKALSSTKAKFVLSTWHHNNYRENEMVAKYWSRFNIITKDHFYHSGGKLENRQSVVEALVFNFDLKDIDNSERDLFSQINM